MTDSGDVLAVLDGLPEATRIRSRRLSQGVATIIADATGLAAGERKDLEDLRGCNAGRLYGTAELGPVLNLLRERAVHLFRGGIGHLIQRIGYANGFCHG